MAGKKKDEKRKLIRNEAVFASVLNFQSVDPYDRIAFAVNELVDPKSGVELCGGRLQVKSPAIMPKDFDTMKYSVMGKITIELVVRENKIDDTTEEDVAEAPEPAPAAPTE